MLSSSVIVKPQEPGKEPERINQHAATFYFRVK